LIPRIIYKLFEDVSYQKENKFEFSASYIEIYNENIKDLLVKNDKKEHNIIHEKSETIISNIKIVKIESPKTFFEFFEKASKNRSISKTECNERSSRSHS
jgi:hypothetical protein